MSFREELLKRAQLNFDRIDKSSPDYKEQMMKTSVQFRRAVGLMADMQAPIDPDLNEEERAAEELKRQESQLELESTVREVVRVLGCQSILKDGTTNEGENADSDSSSNNLDVEASLAVIEEQGGRHGE